MHHRFSVDARIDPDDEVRLEGEELHHAVRVRRIRPGEVVEVFDGSGRAFEAALVSIESDHATLRVLREVPSRESPLRLTLGLALIHPDRFELAIQKATELGVSTIVPMITERIEVRLDRVEKKRDRWERIIAEAVKQCGRASVPNLAPPTALDALIAVPGPRFLLHAEGSVESPAEVSGEATLLIGPEGGFTDDEIRSAIGAGCHPLRLGPRRLRAETAAIAAVALAQARWGDWKALDFSAFSVNN